MPISAALGSSALLPAGLGHRNMIINGAMQVDQRNSGASYTMANATYGLDRWAGYSSASSKYSIQRLTTTPPVGFGYYQRFTSLAATADTADAYYNFYQVIEGFNATQLSWGTANAKSVSLSFWVRSSLTGTFGGTLRNAGSGGYYSYAFTYTINSANIWEYKTISITGSTAGGWGSTNDTGINLFFDLGCHSSQTQAAGSWQNANKLAASGCVRLIGTNAATLDITGVQLEQNYQPTPFEQRPIGVELALCQRYFRTATDKQNTGGCAYSTGIVARFPFNPEMRIAPTASIQTSGSFIAGNDYSANYTASTVTIVNQHPSVTHTRVVLGGFSGTSSGMFLANSDANGTAVLAISAEL